MEKNEKYTIPRPVSALPKIRGKKKLIMIPIDKIVFPMMLYKYPNIDNNSDIDLVGYSDCL